VFRTNAGGIPNTTNANTVDVVCFILRFWRFFTTSCKILMLVSCKLSESFSLLAYCVTSCVMCVGVWVAGRLLSLTKARLHAEIYFVFLPIVSSFICGRTLLFRLCSKHTLCFIYLFPWKILIKKHMIKLGSPCDIDILYLRVVNTI
jgi:hypothetical protein